MDEETALMERVAAGDVTAFTPLVALVLPRLLGYFRRLGADAAFAEDCAQDVLLRVYRVRERYRADARFVTYLLRIARNYWIDVVRHRQAGPRTVSVDAPSGDDEEGRAGELPGRAEPAGGRLARRDLRAALDRAIAALGEVHREVFVLAQIEDLRYQEIAAILQIPVGTVKSRMHAAIRQVRQALAREGFEP